MKEARGPEARLRDWIELRTGPVDEDTLLLEERRLNSLQLVELVLFLEELTGKILRPEQLDPDAFRSIRAICRSFLNTAASQEGHHA